MLEFAICQTQQKIAPNQYKCLAAAPKPRPLGEAVSEWQPMVVGLTLFSLSWAWSTFELFHLKQCWHACATLKPDCHVSGLQELSKTVTSKSVLQMLLPEWLFSGDIVSRTSSERNPFQSEAAVCNPQILLQGGPLSPYLKVICQKKDLSHFSCVSIRSSKNMFKTFFVGGIMRYVYRLNIFK